MHHISPYSDVRTTHRARAVLFKGPCGQQCAARNAMGEGGNHTTVGVEARATLRATGHVCSIARASSAGHTTSVHRLDRSRSSSIARHIRSAYPGRSTPYRLRHRSASLSPSPGRFCQIPRVIIANYNFCSSRLVFCFCRACTAILDIVVLLFGLFHGALRVPILLHQLTSLFGPLARKALRLLHYRPRPPQGLQDRPNIIARPNNLAL